jgi:hypothetical protein
MNLTRSPDTVEYSYQVEPHAGKTLALHKSSQRKIKILD